MSGRVKLLLLLLLLLFFGVGVVIFYNYVPFETFTTERREPDALEAHEVSYVINYRNKNKTHIKISKLPTEGDIHVKVKLIAQDASTINVISDEDVKVPATGYIIETPSKSFKIVVFWKEGELYIGQDYEWWYGCLTSSWWAHLAQYSRALVSQLLFSAPAAMRGSVCINGTGSTRP